MLISQVIILVYSSAYNSQVVSTELADTFYDTSTVECRLCKIYAVHIYFMFLPREKVP